MQMILFIVSSAWVVEHWRYIQAVKALLIRLELCGAPRPSAGAKDVNSEILAPDLTMSDILTSSRLATLTESRVISAQLMSDPTQEGRRSSLESSDSAMYFNYEQGPEVWEVYFGLFQSLPLSISIKTLKVSCYNMSSFTD